VTETPVGIGVFRKSGVNGLDEVRVDKMVIVGTK
jgi:hypothetical protein